MSGRTGARLVWSTASFVPAFVTGQAWLARSRLARCMNTRSTWLRPARSLRPATGFASTSQARTSHALTATPATEHLSRRLPRTTLSSLSRRSATMLTAPPTSHSRSFHESDAVASRDDCYPQGWSRLFLTAAADAYREGADTSRGEAPVDTVPRVHFPGSHAGGRRLAGDARRQAPFPRVR